MRKFFLFLHEEAARLLLVVGIVLISTAPLLALAYPVVGSQDQVFEWILLVGLIFFVAGCLLVSWWDSKRFPEVK